MPHRTTSTDTRLLTNLLQSTQSYTKSFKSTLSQSSTSTAALQAYAAVLPPREAQVLNLVAAQMEEADDAARGFVDVVDKWIGSIGDVVSTEEEVRRVARDRDILVTRLIKASKHSQKHTSTDFNANNNVNISPSSSTAHSIHSLPTSPSNHSQSSNSNSNKKLYLARAELHACEIELNNKEVSLRKARERVVVAGLRERCEALMRFASAVGEAGRLGVGAVDIWERERSKSNSNQLDDDDDEHHRVDKHSMKKPLTNGVYLNGSRFDTNANANTNGISTCDKPSSELSVSGISNASSIAPSQSASQIALVLAHPTPNSSAGPLIGNTPDSRDNHNEDVDRNNVSKSNNHGTHPHEHDTNEIQSDRYGYKLDIPPAHAFDSGVEYSQADQDVDRDGHSHSYSYGNALGGFGSRGYPELRRRITEEDINLDQDEEDDGDGDGDVTPHPHSHLDARPRIDESERRRVEERDEEYAENVDNTDEDASDSPDDMRLSGDGDGGKKVKVIENRPFDRDRNRNRVGKDDANGRKAFSDLGVPPSPSSPSAAHFGSFNMFRGKRGDTLPVRPGIGGGRERKRSFVGALAGLFHRDKERDRDKDKEKERESDVDEGVDVEGLVLPSAFVNMGGRRVGMLRRGDSEDGVGAVGKGKGKGNTWTTRTEGNLKSLSRNGGGGGGGRDSDDGGNVSRRKSRVGVGSYYPNDNGVSVNGPRGGSMDVMSDAGVDYSGTRSVVSPGPSLGGRRRAGTGTGTGMNTPTQTVGRKGNANQNPNANTRANTRMNSKTKTQMQTKKGGNNEIRESEGEGESYGFDKWGVWGSRDDTRTNVGASSHGREGGGVGAVAGKLKKTTQTGSRNTASGSGAVGAGLGIKAAGDELGGKGEFGELKIKGAAAAAASVSGRDNRNGASVQAQKQGQARSQTQAQAPAQDANALSRSGSWRSSESRGGGGGSVGMGGKRTLVSSSTLNASILSYSPGYGTASGSGASTPKARPNMNSNVGGGAGGGKRNSFPSPLSQSNSTLAQPVRRSTVGSGAGAGDMSNARPSLMSIVEGVADINNNANANTTRRGSRLIEVHAPRPISDADLAAPLDVVLKKGRMEAGIEEEEEEREKKEWRGRSGTVQPVKPPPRVSSLPVPVTSGKEGGGVSHREHEHGHELEHRQARTSMQPLKSAMRTRSPSPVIPMSTATVAAPTNVQDQIPVEGDSVPGASENNNGINDNDDPDSVVDTDVDSEEFVDANSEVEVESDEAPPPPPHDKIVSNSQSMIPSTTQSPNGGQARTSPTHYLTPASTSSTTNTTVSPAGSATASTTSPFGGSTSTTTRRKSVRMSLQPTFSPTPPAIDADEDSSDDGLGYGNRSGGGGRYAPWGPASSTVPKSSSTSLNSNSNLTGDNSKSSSNHGHGAVRGDAWADSSEEDEEYSRARKLLWSAAKKMDKAGRIGKKDGR